MAYMLGDVSKIRQGSVQVPHNSETLAFGESDFHSELLLFRPRRVVRHVFVAYVYDFRDSEFLEQHLLLLSGQLCWRIDEELI